MKTTTISKMEWEDYHSVQQSGRINMMLHPLVRKFMPDGNWAKAHEWFEELENEDELIISDEEDSE